MGEGVPQSTCPPARVPPLQPGQDGGKGYRKVPNPPARSGQGVLQGIYLPWPRYLPPSTGQVRMGGRGYPKVPTSLPSKVPNPPPPARSGWTEGVPQGTSPLPAKVPTPWPGQDGEGYPKVPTPWARSGWGEETPPRYLLPSQVRTGGEGVPQGTNPSGQVKMGGEGISQGSYPLGQRYLWPRTCYTAGGMPLAFTQEDFLVEIRSSLPLHGHQSLFINGQTNKLLEEYGFFVRFHRPNYNDSRFHMFFWLSMNHLI